METIFDLKGTPWLFLWAHQILQSSLASLVEFLLVGDMCFDSVSEIKKMHKLFKQLLFVVGRSHHEVIVSLLI